MPKLICLAVDCEVVLSRASASGLCRYHYGKWYAENNRERRRQISAKYRAANVEKTKAAVKASKLKNIDQVKAYNKAWRETNADRLGQARRARYIELHEEMLVRNAKYRKENPEKRRAAVSRWTAANRDRVRAWAKDNPDQKAVREAKRRQRVKENGIFVVTGADILKMLRRHNNQCAYCTIDLTSGYHLDHVMPLSRGGRHSVGNLVPSCPACNLDKSNRTVTEWYKRCRLKGKTIAGRQPGE